MKKLDIKNKLMDISLIHCNEESYIIFVIHHLIIDGVSWNNLLSDLSHNYLKLEANEETELSRPYPYKNWVNDVSELVKNISVTKVLLCKVKKKFLTYRHFGVL